MNKSLVLIAALWTFSFPISWAAAPGECGPSEKVDAALIEAAMTGTLEDLSKQLACGADVNAQDTTGRTALMWSIWRNDPAFVELLVKQPRIKVDLPNYHGQTALLAVFQCKDVSVEIAQLLFDRGANVMIRSNNGTTALIYAADWGDMEKITWLLYHLPPWVLEEEQLARGYVNAPELAGANAIYWAKNSGHQDVVDYLKRLGAEFPKEEPVAETLRSRPKPMNSCLP